MLLELRLRDLGLISQASVSLSAGLNVVTGETGVGKTLLVTSLALLCGARGDARLVRAGAGEAVVEAIVATTPALRSLLERRGLDAGDELVCVRRLGADGRSRAWAAGQLVPLSQLTEIGDALCEMHGQGAGFALARPATQLRAIDALAGNDALLERYRAALVRLREAESMLESLTTSVAARAREIDVLTYQVDEIDRAKLAPDSDDAVHAALSRLEHAERLSATADAVHALVGAEGAAGALAEAHKALEHAAMVDAQAVPLVSLLADIATNASELARDIRAWSATLEGDPAQLEALRERNALLAGLKRKYGGTAADVIAFADAARARLAELADGDAALERLQTDVDEHGGRVKRLAAELSKHRAKAAKRLSKLVSGELPALALPNASFEAACSATEPMESGADRIEFRFSSTRSRAPDLIGKIASGGELSRAMIAVTLALASSHEISVLVFDEADQGVGGEAALELARRLARLGRSHQVLVVSHLPQIAAFADRHIAVRREGDEIDVTPLDDDGRLAEVSRMLAGLESSYLARAHAAELIELAEGERREPDERPAAARAG